MAAIDRFRGANTKFSERGEYLAPIQREEKQEDGSTKLVYDSPAIFTLKISRCLWKTARPPKRGEYYIVEGEVVRSSNPRVAEGSIRTWMQSMDNDAGQTAVTAFMFAALGLDRRNSEDYARMKEIEDAGKLPEMLAETLAKDPTDPLCKNALEGCVVDVEVKEITTKGKGLPFNLHTWSPHKA
jgi:hypothetical protein